MRRSCSSSLEWHQVDLVSWSLMFCSSRPPASRLAMLRGHHVSDLCCSFISPVHTLLHVLLLSFPLFCVSFVIMVFRESDMAHVVIFVLSCCSSVWTGSTVCLCLNQWRACSQLKILFLWFACGNVLCIFLVLLDWGVSCVVCVKLSYRFIVCLFSIRFWREVIIALYGSIWRTWWR